MKYSLKDMGVIIATYNRHNDLAITLDSFKDKLNLINELIIVDQSTTNPTKLLTRHLKNVKYYYTPIPSLTSARNFGIDKLKKSSKIVIFLDDDVTLSGNYFEKIIEIFNNYPLAKGVTGHYFPDGKKINPLEMMIRRIMRLEYWALDVSKKISVYGQVYPSKLTKVIPAQWLSGFNMAFKREVFEKHRFEEKFTRYALAEDFDFSTRVLADNPNSFFMTPYAKITHRVSTIERTPSLKVTYMNHVNRSYIQMRSFNSLKHTFYYIWAVMSIIFFQFVSCFKLNNSSNVKKLINNFMAIIYSFSKRAQIKNGLLELPNFKKVD